MDVVGGFGNDVGDEDNAAENVFSLMVDKLLLDALLADVLKLPLDDELVLRQLHASSLLSLVVREMVMGTLTSSGVVGDGDRGMNPTGDEGSLLTSAYDVSEKCDSTRLKNDTRNVESSLSAFSKYG